MDVVSKFAFITFVHVIIYFLFWVESTHMLVVAWWGSAVPYTLYMVMFIIYAL